MGKGEEEEGKKKRKEEEEGEQGRPSLKSSRISSSYSRALAQRSWEAHTSHTGYTPLSLEAAATWDVGEIRQEESC